MQEELLKIENGMKNIDGYDILAGVQIQVFKNKICGIMSGEQQELEVLWEILQGKQKLDYGTFYINERKVSEEDAPEVLKENVTVIDGSSHLIGSLSLAENLFVISRDYKERFLDLEKLEKKLEILFDMFHISIDIHTSVSQLSHMEQFKIELLKAYTIGIKLVLVDIRSNNLPSEEVDELFELIGKMKERNITFIVWNPVLEQTLHFSDQLLIIKNGRTARIFGQSEFDEKVITRILLGNPEKSLRFGQLSQRSQLAFRMEHVSENYLFRASFEIYSGEIVCIHCDEEQGLSHFYKVMSGETQVRNGKMTIGSKDFTPKCLEDAIEHGVGFIENISYTQTLFYQMTVLENVCIVKGNYLKAIWWKRRYRDSIRNTINSVFGKDICDKRLGELTETELQKVLFCRFMIFHPKLLVLVNPFIGGCINMNEESLKNIQMTADRGIAVLILTGSRMKVPQLHGRHLILTKAGVLMERIQRYE
ncbi:ATP-binding cassette domain-containing protein [Ruminococcus sp. OA3]|uniref:ATP-binding cassette domain-containing protein n=1 Tax=Ruminococcus sp. OA3 TaxID=2914164 RepID=UPI001F070CAD|nr:ATP-binding cassette domain-containing protein [Ruminococcus sp. OA3]MCH1983283.1 ATP-binding cassette domain-containing protein [Ruminococcus sp. OA3]